MTKKIATAAAQVLCARLGPGWEPQVWENLGWRYQAVFPLEGDDAQVRVSDYSQQGNQPLFRAEIRPGTTAGSIGLGSPTVATLQFWADAEDPRQAVKKAWDLMDLAMSEVVQKVKTASLRLSTWEAGL